MCASERTGVITVSKLLKLAHQIIGLTTAAPVAMPVFQSI